MRFEKHPTDRAIGPCGICGTSLKGPGIDTGPAADDTICLVCAAEITNVFLALEGKVTVLAQFKSDPVAYLTEHGFLDGKGRVRPEHMPKPAN